MTLSATEILERMKHNPYAKAPVPGRKRKTKKQRLRDMQKEMDK